MSTELAKAVLQTVLQDALAVSLARAVAAANIRAQESGVDVLQSLITITQHPSSEEMIWRVN